MTKDNSENNKVNEEDNKKKKKPSTLKRLLPYMGNKKALFPIAMIFSGISSVLNLLPFVFLWLIAREIFIAPENMNMESVSFYAWMALLSTFVAIFSYFLALVFSHLAAFRVEVGMRKAGMEKIIRMPLGFFDKNSGGKMRKIIDDNASQTHSFLAHQLPDLAGSVVSPMVLLLLLFVFDWRLGLVLLIPLGLGIFAMSRMMSSQGEKFRIAYMNSLEEMSSEAVEYVRGIPVVKTFGQSVFAFKRFVDSILKYRDMVNSFTLLWNHPMSFYTVIMQAAAFFLVPFAILFINSGNNIAEVLTDFIFYLVIAPNFAVVFMRSMYFMQKSELAAQILDRFDAILQYSTIEFPEHSQPFSKEENLQNDLEFKNVVFSYTSEKNVINNISFQVEAGQRVALVGTSGGGKTTLARLAARFWDVGEGEILIGGVDIRRISQKDLMQKIAFVFQNTKLFKTSLRENIVYGKENVSESEIQRALELSQSQEIIDTLPRGLDTVIGSKGTYLSGGEQQRIALARAIVKDAPIVLLDEATAFADPENEHLIQKALKELSKGKTTLMIAHRLTSVQDADKILVIDGGCIAEQGSHNELLQKGGIYNVMWNEYQKSVDWKI